MTHDQRRRTVSDLDVDAVVHLIARGLTGKSAAWALGKDVGALRRALAKRSLSFAAPRRQARDAAAASPTE